MTSIRLFSFLLLLACFGSAAASAQEPLCAQTVEKAIASIQLNCADLARGSLCYSYPHVDAAYAGAGGNAFNRPSDRASVAELASVRTSALDLEREHWGVALLNLSANLPQTHQGPGIIVMLAGDAALINEVDPAEVPALGAPLSTAAVVDTMLFRHPGIIPESVRSAAADEILLVDAFDDSGEWLRVVNDGSIAWVKGDDVARLNAMAALPTQSASARPSHSRRCPCPPEPTCRNVTKPSR